jgi:hypothetical protein
MQTRGRFRFFLSAACGNLASAIESPQGREQSGLRGDFKSEPELHERLFPQEGIAP